MRGPFTDTAIDLAARGLAVIPLGGDDGKKPIVKWARWQAPPRPNTVRRMVESHPSANIGLVCHLSGITVVDIDDPSLVAPMLERFGCTPLQFSTPSGGTHLLYRHGGERNANLRTSEGLAVDIKGIGGVIVIPPSVRPSGPHAGKPYCFQLGDWGRLEHIPHLREGALLQGRGAPRPDGHRGQRNRTLFNYLLEQAPYCDDFDALLDVAHTRNLHFAPPLPDREVFQTAKNAWGYQQRGQNWVAAKTRSYDLNRELQMLAPHPDAFLLLVFLRRTHAHHSEFAISAKAMAAKQVLPGWTTARYRKARKILVKFGFLVVLHVGGSGVGDVSLYQLRAPLTEQKGL